MWMQALLALTSRSKGLLLLHVVLSMMVGAALGAHNAAIFLDWEVRCSSLVAVQARHGIAMHSGPKACGEKLHSRSLKNQPSSTCMHIGEWPCLDQKSLKSTLLGSHSNSCTLNACRNDLHACRHMGVTSQDDANASRPDPGQCTSILQGLCMVDLRFTSAFLSCIRNIVMSLPCCSRKSSNPADSDQPLGSSIVKQC